MSDLIKREDVIRSLQSMMQDCFPEAEEELDAVVTTVRGIPSAEPERKKGKWSNYKDEHCCSVCKCVVISDCWDDEIRYDYCPYCGAEMLGE